MIRRAPKRPLPDLSGSLAALRRAAKAALELGLRTGTPVWVIQDGKMVDLTKLKRAGRAVRKG